MSLVVQLGGPNALLYNELDENSRLSSHDFASPMIGGGRQAALASTRSLRLAPKRGLHNFYARLELILGALTIMDLEACAILSCLLFNTHTRTCAYELEKEKRKISLKIRVNRKAEVRMMMMIIICSKGVGLLILQSSLLPNSRHQDWAANWSGRGRALNKAFYLSLSAASCARCWGDNLGAV